MPDVCMKKLFFDDLSCLLSSTNTRSLMYYLAFLSRIKNSSVFYQNALRSIKTPASKDIHGSTPYYLEVYRPTQRKSALHAINHAIKKEMQKSRILQTLKTKPWFFDAKNFQRQKAGTKRQHASRKFPYTDYGLLRIPNNLESGAFHRGETSTISFTLKLDCQEQLQYKPTSLLRTYCTRLEGRRTKFGRGLV